MEKEKSNQDSSDRTDQRIQPNRPISHLMVATDLSTLSIEVPADTPLQTDRLINKKVYRLLDIPYYCWLRSRIDRAIVAVDARKITISIFDRLCVAFDRVHRWAVTHLDQEDLLQAFISFKPEGYISPRVNRQGECISAFTYPKGGHWRFTHPVKASAVYKVKSIAPQALPLGWSELSLFQNRSNQLKHPFGEHWGLITFLRPDYRVGNVTHEAIELVGPKPFENVMRFQNPGLVIDAQQQVFPSQKEQFARPIAGSSINQKKEDSALNNHYLFKRTKRGHSNMKNGAKPKDENQKSSQLSNKPQLSLFSL